MAWPAVAGDTILFSTRTRMLAFRLPPGTPDAPPVAFGVLAALLVASAFWVLRRQVRHGGATSGLSRRVVAPER